MEYFHTVKAILPGSMSECRSDGPTACISTNYCQDLSSTVPVCTIMYLFYQFYLFFALQLQPLRKFTECRALCTSQVFRIGPWQDLPWPDQARVHSQHNQHQKLKRIAAFSQSGALANGAVPRSTFVLFNVCTTQESK